MVYGKGINDMPNEWIKENKLNKKIYKKWCGMLERCYSEKFLEKNPTYKDCYVCDRWHILSNFVEDISKIDNYELWINGFEEKRNPYELDKDIKSNGNNKCYCLENCIFVLQSDNAKQAVSTRNNEYLYERTGEDNPFYNKHHTEEWKKEQSERIKGESNPFYGIKKNGGENPNSKKIKQVMPNNEIKIWECIKQASDELGISYEMIKRTVKGKRKNHEYKGSFWYYITEGDNKNE